MARTRARDFEDRQRTILESAAAVFAAQGMDQASMAGIAAHAGVSKGLLYHYYASKEALIFAIILSHLLELDEAVEAADDATLAPRQRLQNLVAAVLATYRGADNKHKVQLNASGALSDDQRSEIQAVERRIVGRFSAVLKEINPALAGDSRRLLMPVTMSLFGMLNWVYLWFREGGPITREDYAKLATTLIVEGVTVLK